jgi:hypothetical protein
MSYPLPSSLLVKANIVAWLSIDIGIRIVNAMMLVLVLRCLSKTLGTLICMRWGLVGLGAADLVVSALEIVSSWSVRQ